MSFLDSLAQTPLDQGKTLGQQYAQNPEQTIMSSNTPLASVAAPTTQQGGGIPIFQPKTYAKGGITAADSMISKEKHDAKAMMIITHYFQNAGIPLDKGLQALQQQIQDGLKLIQFERSVMGVKVLGKGVAQIHFFTNGTPKDLVDDMQFFIKNLKKTGVTTVYDTMPAPITTKAFVDMGAKVEPSDNEKFKFKATI